MPLFPLPIRVQLALGADVTAYPNTWTWTDVSSYLRQSPSIRISRGRSDESGQTQPGQCTLQMDNTSGDWDPRNPLGAWYGQLRKGTPLRVEVDAGSGWEIRFTGFVAELPPRVDPSDSDAWVELVAAGQLRRLGQNSSTHSAIYRMLHSYNLQAHLPLEEPSGSTALVVAIPNQPAPTMSGVTLGQSDCPPGAAASARLDTTSSFINIPVAWATARPPTGFTNWTVSWYWKAGATLGSDANLVTIYTSSPVISRVVVHVDSSAVWATLYDTTGAQYGSPAGIAWPVDPTTVWWGVSIYATGIFSTSQIELRLHQVGSRTLSSTVIASFFGAFQGWPTQAVLNGGGVANSLFSHVAVAAPGVNTSSNNYLDAPIAYVGESASNRISRLAIEEPVPLTVVEGSPPADGDTLMGPQPVGTALSLMREVEATDGGILYEGVDGSLTYLPRWSRYNRTADLSATADQLVPPLEPTDDDQHVVNDATVSRSSGGSARYVDYDHLDTYGQYDKPFAVNTAGDDQLPDEASWQVHLGTVAEVRVPTVVLDLAAAEALAADWLACDVGSRMVVSTMPSGLSRADLDQHIEGYTETIDTFTWQAAINASPAAGWQVVVVDGDQRVTGDGSTLAADITSSATSLQIASTAAGGVWTTDAAHFPLDVVIGGERITLSAISGSSSPQSATVSARAVNGISKSHSADDAVEVADPAIVAK